MDTVDAQIIQRTGVGKRRCTLRMPQFLYQFSTFGQFGYATLSCRMGLVPYASLRRAIEVPEPEEKYKSLGQFKEYRHVRLYKDLLEQKLRLDQSREGIGQAVVTLFTMIGL